MTVIKVKQLLIAGKSIFCKLVALLFEVDVAQA
jgi:hypothetical protein